MDDLGLRFRGITTNTQTRRLAYLSASTTLLALEPTSQDRLSTALLEWSADNSAALQTHLSSKGRIRSQGAAERYVRLAGSLRMATRVYAGWQLTAEGLLLKTLLPAPPSFELSVAERLYYLQQLLTYDADTLLALAGCVASEPGQRLKEIELGFQAAFVRWLRLRLRSTTDEAAVRSLSDRVSGIEAWTKPHVYAEHLVAPRLHWLLDLGLLDVRSFRHGRYALTPDSVLLFTDLIRNGTVPSRPWAIGRFIGTSPLLDEAKLSDPTTDDTLAAQFRRTINALRVGTAPRVRLDHAVRHASLSLASEGHIYVPDDTILRWLSHTPKLHDGTVLRIREAARARESYIMLEQ